MPVAYAFDLLGGDIGHWWTLTKWFSALSLVWGLRTWSRGYVCREEKELAGKTYILTVRANSNRERPTLCAPRAHHCMRLSP